MITIYSLLQEESRRFRIKLAAKDNASSVEVCRQCVTVLSNFISFREMGSSQAGIHDNSFMESQSLLDCSQSQQPSLSPVRTTVHCLATNQSATSSVTAPYVETSSLAKVKHHN